MAVPLAYPQEQSEAGQGDAATRGAADARIKGLRSRLIDGLVQVAMAQSDPSALWRGRLEILGSQVVREQLRDGKIPAENRSFVLSWLGEKDKETADFTARTTAAAERAAAAAEGQTLVAQKP